jgi:hypothetical protein
MLAGILFILMQLIHPLDVLSSVTTSQWAIVHYLGVTMSLLALLGLAGLYLKQAEKVGWLGLAGYLLFSLFYVFTLAFQFTEAVILPLLAIEAPNFTEGWLAISSGHSSEVNLGALPGVNSLTGLAGYVLGGLLFSLATLRAGLLPRGAAGLLAFAAVSVLAAPLLGHPLDRVLAIPMGVALAWLGYALLSERRGYASESVPGKEAPALSRTVLGANAGAR